MHVYIHKIDLDTDENGPSTIWLKPLYNHPRRTLGKKTSMFTRGAERRCAVVDALNPTAFGCVIQTILQILHSVIWAEVEFALRERTPRRTHLP